MQQDWVRTWDRYASVITSGWFSIPHPAFAGNWCRSKIEIHWEKSPCSWGCVYIGETKKALEVRIKEHQTATRRGKLEKSAIAEHTWNHHHQIQWDDIKVLVEAIYNSTLLLKEAIHIHLAATDSLLNRDEGVAIPECWTSPILDTIFMELKRRWRLIDCYSI